jgi:RNA polymerase sigma factor (sigma-70 family)
MSTSESELLDDLRPRAFAIAYRMLGSVSAAEDIVQEALVRIHQAIERGEEVSSPRACVGTITTRLAIDELRSARAAGRATSASGFRSPIAESSDDDPAARAETADSLSLAFLVLLESLAPEQRAALLLHNVFHYGYDEVAEIVGTSEGNARQLASRARRHVQEGRPRFEPSAELRERLAESFFAAAENGEFEALEALLTEDVELHGDGGGLAPAIKRPAFGRVKGRPDASQLVADLGSRRRRASPRERERSARGRVPRSRRRLIGVLTLDIAAGQIQAIRSIVNPEKLGHLGHVGDANALIARMRESDNQRLTSDSPRGNLASRPRLEPSPRSR